MSPVQGFRSFKTGMQRGHFTRERLPTPPSSVGALGENRPASKPGVWRDGVRTCTVPLPATQMRHVLYPLLAVADCLMISHSTKGSVVAHDKTHLGYTLLQFADPPRSP